MVAVEGKAVNPGSGAALYCWLLLLLLLLLLVVVLVSVVVVTVVVVISSTYRAVVPRDLKA